MFFQPRQISLKEKQFVDSLIEKYNEGEKADIQLYYNAFVRHTKALSADEFWYILVLYIADKYTKYDFNEDDSYNFRKMCTRFFSIDGIAYKKLVCVDELLNYATKYYLDDHGDLFSDNPYISSDIKYDRERKYNKLLKMIELIYDSTFKENYRFIIQ